jgi:hypothetical protein
MSLKKNRQECSQTNFVSKLIPSFYSGKNWATSVIFKKLPVINFHPIGESSPNLVTLFIMFLGSLNQNTEHVGNICMYNAPLLCSCDRCLTKQMFRFLNSKKLFCFQYHYKPTLSRPLCRHQQQPIVYLDL